MDESIRSHAQELNRWRLKASEAIQAIYAEDYYISLWEAIEGNKPKERKVVEHYPDKPSLLAPFQAFWEALPESSAIRRYPFYLVCELAEEYCFGEDAVTPEREAAAQKTVASAAYRLRKD